jgi:hypothetical protein
VSGRDGGRAWPAIAGDRSDLAGFPRLVEEFCQDMAARGYSERTAGNRRFMLSYLVAWLAERGITRISGGFANSEGLSVLNSGVVARDG